MWFFSFLICNVNTWQLLRYEDCDVSTYAKVLIWKQFTTKNIAVSAALGCFYLCKSTNLKAIHNTNEALFLKGDDVSTYAKVLIWKQFTTVFGFGPALEWCFYLCKSTNLKAIHNPYEVNLQPTGDVSTYAKVLIWKQFTTHQHHWRSTWKMFLPMQKY